MKKAKDNNLITQTLFAEELGVSQPYIAKLVRLRKITLEGGKVNRKKALLAMKGRSDPCRQSVFNQAPPTSKQESEDADPQNPTTILHKANAMGKHYSAHIIKMRHDELKRKLVDREKYDDIILRGLAARDIVVKKYILSIPDRLARHWHNKEEANKLKVMARKEIRIALEELTQVDITEIEKEMRDG